MESHRSVFWRLLVLTVLHFGSLAALLLSARWLRDMGGSEAVLGWFSASIVPGIVLGAPLAGRLAGRLGERRLMLFGIVLVGAAALAFSRFEAISWWLAPLRFLQGVGHGIVFTSLFSLAAHIVPDSRKSQGIGYVALAAQIGNVTGVGLAEWLLSQAGFPAAFVGAAGLALIAWLGVWTLPGATAAHGARAAVGSGWLTPRAWQVGVAVAFFAVLGGSYGTVLQMVPLLTQDVARATGGSGAATPVMAAIFLTVAGCRLFLARLADGRHRKALLTGVTLLLIAATLAWPAAASVPQLMGVAVLFAVGYGLLFPGLNGLVLAALAPAWRSRAAGWMVMAFDGGFFGLLLALGPVAAHVGRPPMFALLAALQLVGALAFAAMLWATLRLSGKAEVA